MLDKFIKENLNGDICLVDCYVGVVIVMDRIGEFRFWYVGLDFF